MERETLPGSGGWMCVDESSCDRAYERRTRWHRRRALGVAVLYEVRGPWQRRRSWGME